MPPEPRWRRQLLGDNSYAAGEPDRVILFVSLKAERDGKPVFHETWAMDAWGDVRGTAMGRLVSVPVSLAVEAVLNREIPAGVHAAPHDPQLLARWLGQVRASGAIHGSGSTIWPEARGDLVRSSRLTSVGSDSQARRGLCFALIRDDPDGQPDSRAAGRHVGSKDKPSKQIDRLADRLAALAARRARPASGFVSQPEPRSIGLYARGKQLVAGNILLAGHLAEAPGAALWDIAAPDPAFAAEAQGFAWLDDLAALGNRAARARAQDWTWGWIARYRRGAGAGLDAGPDRAADHPLDPPRASFLLQGRDKAAVRCLSTAPCRGRPCFLSRRWKAAAPGLPRFEALTGLIYAGLSLIGHGGAGRPGRRGAGAAIARPRSTPRAASPPATPKNCWRC